MKGTTHGALVVSACAVCLAAMTGCEPTAAEACARKVDVVRSHALARVHGLTADDDARAELERLEAAQACAGPRAVAEGAGLLRSRLGARGAVAELGALGRTLAGVPPERARVELATGAHEVHRRVEEFSQREGMDPWLGAILRQERPPVGKTTRALVTFSNERETCAAIIPGEARPVGTIHLEWWRGDTVIQTHGDPAVVQWSEQRAPAVVLCTAQPLAMGERVRLRPAAGGTPVELELVGGGDAVVRGALRLHVAMQQPRPTVCEGMVEPRAQAACALLR